MARGVAERILRPADLELSVRTRIDFKEHRVPGLEAFWVSNQPWSVGPPDCFTTLRVPDIINHTSQTDWDPSDRTDRARAYEVLIRWALPEWTTRWIDGALLVDIWDELERPEEIRICWAPAFVHGVDRQSAEIFRDTIFARDPDGTATVRVRSYDGLPPLPSPSRRPRRRVGPLNGHPWGYQHVASATFKISKRREDGDARRHLRWLRSHEPSGDGRFRPSDKTPEPVSLGNWPGLDRRGR